MTMKVHMLQHIPYESTKGFIKAMIHGTRYNYFRAGVKINIFLNLEGRWGIR